MSLADLFLQAQGVDPRSLPVSERDAAEQQLAATVASCAREWPGVDLPPEAFVVYVAERVPRSEPLSSALTRLRTRELYLACACSRGDSQAMATLESHYLRGLDAALGRLAADPLQRDEVKQLLRIKLFTPQPGEPPKISEYRGRGSLSAWLKVAATRTALNLRRGATEAPHSGEELASALPGPWNSPELEHLKQSCREELRRAIQEAFSQLDARQRNLLRQHHLDGLRTLDLATLYRVHRVTAGRWIDEAHEQLVAGVREILRVRLGDEPQALSSIFDLFESRLDLSIGTLLRSLPPR